MGISKDGLKSAMLTAMAGKPDNQDDAIELMAGAIVDYLKVNLEVKVPAGEVVTNATGQIVVTKNLKTIDCEVS